MEKAGTQDNCPHQLKLYMQDGDDTTVFMQERQWMALPKPLVTEDGGQEWLPAQGMAFLISKPTGEPKLEPHLPVKDKGVFPNAAKVEKQVRKWAKEMVANKTMEPQFEQEWKEFFEAKPWTKDPEELPADKLPSYRALPTPYNEASEAPIPAENPVAAAVTQMHTTQPFDGIAAHTGHATAP